MFYSEARQFSEILSMQMQNNFEKWLPEFVSYNEIPEHLWKLLHLGKFRQILKSGDYNDLISHPISPLSYSFTFFRPNIFWRPEFFETRTFETSIFETRIFKVRIFLYHGPFPPFIFLHFLWILKPTFAGEHKSERGKGF